MGGVGQLVWMLVEAFLLGTALCGLARLHRWLGVIPLAMMIGALQFIQVVLAIGVYIEVYPGMLLSPGSVVLFPATLVGVLFVYILEDAVGARKLIYSIFLANLLLSGITLAVSLHLSGPATRMLVDIPKELFLQNPRTIVVGTLTLFVDTILVILIFESLTKVRSLFLRIWFSLFLVLTFDSFAFVTGAFIESKHYGSILLSGLFGKTVMSIPYAVAAAIFQKVFHNIESSREDGLKDVFQHLTYRERYEHQYREARLDSLTGLKNRRAFDEDLAALESKPLSLLLLDIDHFKSVNDDFGHDYGDKILQQVGQLISQTLRVDDKSYRHGGEEFAIILPNAEKSTAESIAHRIGNLIHKHFTEKPLPDGRGLTATIGLSVSKDDKSWGEELVRFADKRLYHGKRSGRNQVVTGTKQ